MPIAWVLARPGYKVKIMWHQSLHKSSQFTGTLQCTVHQWQCTVHQWFGPFSDDVFMKRPATN